MSRNPHWALPQVKELASRPSGLRLSVTKARSSFPTATAAFAAARAMIAALKASDFVESLFQNPDVCDVYAVQLSGSGWYVKLTILTEQSGDLVMLISFHPLRHAIRKANGHEVKP